MHNSLVILSIETATRGGSICVLRDSSVLASLVCDPEVSHASSLLTGIDEALRSTGLPLDSVQLLAAAAGPGSFTGLRIGLATIKALAATLDRPCVGINTLHAIAHAGGPSQATVAALPAGRGELFAQLFTVRSPGEITELDAPDHLSPAKILEKYASLATLKWCGEGAHLHLDTIKEFAAGQGIPFRDGFAESHLADRGWTLASRERNLAREIAVLASKQWERGLTETAHALRAIYVRQADAELKELWQQPV